MAINWQTLELNIKNYLESGKNDLSRTRKIVAKTIETFYLQEVQAGATDVFQNPILSLTISEGSGLHVSLENGFNSSFNTNQNTVLNQTGMKGAIDHWASAQLAFLIPAPGMAYGVNNTVSMPGSLFPMNLITTSQTQDLFAKELVRVLKSHAGTIQGLYSGITPAGTPIVVPWVGIL
jgi:hypothetical protein